MPTAARLIVSDEPPALMNGRVIPVIGTSATTTPMLMNAWRHSQAVIPAASSAPNVSGAPSAIRIPVRQTTNSPTTMAAPTSPSSSPMIAKMKSLLAFGTNSPPAPRLWPSPGRRARPAEGLRCPIVCRPMSLGYAPGSSRA